MLIQPFWTRLFITAGLFAVSICFGTPTAKAAFTYSQITSNGAENPSAQISAEVSELAGQVLFKFINDDPSGFLPSRISEVYWDDDLGLLSNGPTNDPGSTTAGVNLSNIPASPANVPSGNNVGFFADFSAGRAGGAANGVDPGESVGFLFDGDLSNVLDAIGSGDLKLAMHVISIGAGGNSESLLADAPEPTSLILAVFGLLGLSVTSRSRLRS